MNVDAESETDPAVASPAPLEDMVQHPGRVVLVAAGLGIIAALVVRSLAPPPPPPRNRVLDLLEDIRRHVTRLSKPLYEGATRLAETGGDALEKGMDRVEELHLERKFKKLRQWLNHLVR